MTGAVSENLCDALEAAKAPRLFRRTRLSTADQGKSSEAPACVRGEVRHRPHHGHSQMERLIALVICTLCSLSVPKAVRDSDLRANFSRAARVRVEWSALNSTVGHLERENRNQEKLKTE